MKKTDTHVTKKAKAGPPSRADAKTAKRRTRKAASKTISAPQGWQFRPEDRLHEAQKLAQIGDWEFDPANGLITWSDELYSIFGLDPKTADLSIALLLKYIHPDDRKYFEREIASGLPHRSDYRILLNDGSLKHIHEEVRVLRDKQGKLILVSGTAQDVTRQKQTEAALRKSEARYRAVVETSVAGFCVLDREGRIMEVNDAYVRRSGYSRQELLSMRIHDLEARENAEEAAAHIEKIIRDGTDVFESLHRAKDGTFWHVEVYASFWPIEGGRFFTFFLDIPRRKRYEALLRTRLELSELANRGSIDDLLQHALDAAEQLTGSSIGFFHFVDDDQEHLTLQTWSTNTLNNMCTAEGKGQHYPISQAGVWVDCYHAKKAVIHNEYANLPHRKGLPPGHAPVTREIAVPVFRDGKIVAITGVGNKNTEYMQADADLVQEVASLVMDLVFRKRAEAEREQFYKFFLTSNDLMCIAGLDGYFKMINPAWTTTLGYTTEELLQKPFADFMHPEDVEPTVKEVERQAKGNYTVNFVNRYWCKDGSYKWLEWKATPPKDDVIYAIARDITDRKQAEEKFRESEKLIRNILDTVDEGFIVVDRDYRILIANKAYCGRLAKACDDVIGAYCYEVSHDANKPCFDKGEECAVQQVFSTGEPATVVHTRKSHDGKTMYVETKAYPLKDASGHVTSAIETITNITEKRLLDEERLKNQKLESIGTLAGGIAHDFNNLLQGVFGYISLAKMKVDQREKCMAALDEAEQALHRSISLTTQLLTFSKGGKPVKKVISLAPVLENAARFALSGSRSEAVFNIDPALWQVDADGNQLAQVFQNVVQNADQAMPLGGKIVISAKNIPSSSPEMPAAFDKQDLVLISVQDSGVGIPAQYLSRIFDPYFTTKEKGSGLGLATSYSIIRNHVGLIDVRSEMGTGTTFFIYLVADRSAMSEEPSPTEPAFGARTCRILLMDDEEIVRSVAQQLLNALGHTVEFAAHGEEAVMKYQQAAAAGQAYDIVILDLTIRGGTGGEATLKKLLEIDPDVKAVVSSGYSDDAVIAEYGKYGFKASLKKPYDIRQLQNILLGLLK